MEWLEFRSVFRVKYFCWIDVECVGILDFDEERVCLQVNDGQIDEVIPNISEPKDVLDRLLAADVY